MICSINPIEKFQSTPPHGGRQIVVVNAPEYHRFQSTPRMGGDLPADNKLTQVTVFQSTPPHGGRPHHCLARCIVVDHVDPRPRMGGDAASSLRMAWPAYSNPRPRMGATKYIGDYYRQRITFQSTPPHGGRPL